METENRLQYFLPKARFIRWLRGEKPFLEILEFIRPGLLEPIILSDGKINPNALLALCFIIIGGDRLRNEGKCCGLLLVSSQCNDIHTDFQKIVIYFLGKARFGNRENFQHYFEKNFGNYFEINICQEFIRNLTKSRIEVSKM
jgi:hypothetical protein